MVGLVGNLIVVIIGWFASHAFKQWFHAMVTKEMNALSEKMDKLSEMAVINKVNNISIKSQMEALKNDVCILEKKTNKILMRLNELKCMRGIDCEEPDRMGTH
jgi:hypothetical protein